MQVAGITVPKKIEMWYQNALKISKNVLESVVLPVDTVFVLGNDTLYPLALYMSLQMAEFFGTTVVAHKLEEFCHSPVFGVRNAHQLVILGQKEKSIAQKLGKLDLKISYIELYNQDILSQLFESIFFVQNLMILLAERYGSTELYYRMSKHALKVSSEIIY